jgi:mono/diheme cytochrome c family protein
MKPYTPYQNPKYRSVRRLFLSSFLVTALVLGFIGPDGGGGLYAHTDDPGDHKGHGAQTSKAIGATAYKHMCTFCHGEDGNGGGKAMAYLYPWPRDFRKGVFKYRSTPSGSLPLDSDIFKTISKGIKGTAMPAWESALTEDETWAIVEYIKSFSSRFQTEKPKKPIDPGPTPSTTPDSIKRGEQVYQEMRCSRCHGTDLKGGGPMADTLYDIWDHRAFVYDLTNPNINKFGYEKRDLFMTLTTGIDGTPMKSFSHLTDAERWDLVAYIRSKIQVDRLQKAEYEIDLYSQQTDQKIENDPESPLWNDIPSHDVQLIALNARKNPINRVRFQSVVNDKEIAIRVVWDDPVANRTSSRHQDFKDAVALEFALGDVLLHTHGHNEPFFGMGNRSKPVNIWQWRADWQTEIETKKELEYATKGMDMDVMIFGGEVNPVESLNPFRNVPIEELNAEGFGTLTPQPRTKQNIVGQGIWKDGQWHVVFRRSLKSLNKWDVKFKKQQPILIAFAVWDGAYQDRNGRKMVSMWQRLNLP